jgi:hypothetical protein
MAERVNIPDPPTPLNNDTENQGVTTPFLDGADQPDNLRFEQVNACTWKLTDGSMTITPTPPGRQWEGHKTTRALAWLMGLGHGKWLARYRDQAIGPSAFNKAKADVLKMVRRELVVTGLSIPLHMPTSFKPELRSWPSMRLRSWTADVRMSICSTSAGSTSSASSRPSAVGTRLCSCSALGRSHSTAPPPAPFKAITIRLRWMPMETQSFLPVWTAEAVRPWRRQHEKRPQALARLGPLPNSPSTQHMEGRRPVRGAPLVSTQILAEILRMLPAQPKARVNPFTSDKLQRRSGVDLTRNSLSGHKGQEEERSYQRKTRHEKGHNRSMFLNQRIQHLYRFHDAAPSK